MPEIKVGLVGAGFIGRCHARAFHAVATVFPDAPAVGLEMLAEATETAAARAATELRFRNRDGLAVERKGVQDQVTAVDRDIEAAIRARLGALFPDDGVLGEEGGDRITPRLWVVDPIDGTALLPCRPMAWAGERQWRRQACFNGLNCHSPATIMRAPPRTALVPWIIADKNSVRASSHCRSVVPAGVRPRRR